MKTCPTCGVPFANRKGMRKHHTDVHGESLVKTIEETCDHCGDSFEYTDSENRTAKYCSRTCANRDRPTDRKGSTYGD